MDAALWTALAITLVSLISLIGALATTRWMSRHSVLLFLVAMAAGSLLGDAVLHLLPEGVEMAEGFGPEISLVVLGGFLAFFLLEIAFKQRHAHGEDALGQGHDHHPEPARVQAAKDREQHASRRAEDPAHRPGRHPNGSQGAAPSLPPNAREAGHRRPKVAAYGYLNLVGDALHNFLDGIIIAASFLVSVPLGIATSIAVLLHELPQELADYAVLLRSGMKRRQALAWNFATALTAALGAALVFLIPGATDTVHVWALPAIAGGFLYIAAADLIPELHHHTGDRHVWLILSGLLTGLGAMVALLGLE